jgi:soluble lytic murein transglycosylase-like protein
VRYWEKEILTWADQWDLDPNLIATIIQIESCGDPKVKSPAGATGLFQVMPYHFAPGENPYRPGINARRGLAYLKRSLKAFNGNIRLALAGYNAGISGASRPESLWPTETQRYVYWGEHIYTDARENKRSSRYLNEWLDRGGAYLCTRAQKEQSKR